MQSTQNNPAQAKRRVDRAIDELRRAGTVVLAHGQHHLLVRAAEFPPSEGQDTLAEWSLIISGARARRLGLAKDSAQPVGLQVDDASLEKLMSLISGESTKLRLKDMKAQPVSPGGRSALRLVKLASLLPAAMVAALPESDWAAAHDLIGVEAEDIESYPDNQSLLLRKVSEATIPLADAHEARVIVFEPQPGGAAPHLAILIGSPETTDTPYVRLHSSCLTGDLLGSLRCDCGDQLRLAIRTIAEKGSGIIVYLNQEGRGIGIANKLRAYALQDGGLDTVDANEEMGFDADERHFQPAAEILRQLGHARVRLMTNNIHKVEALEVYGITVVERVPLVIAATELTKNYLETKATKCGHVF